VTEICREKLGIDIGETTDDGKFTLQETECLGACVNAPVVQVNDDYYENLSREDAIMLIDDLSAGRVPQICKASACCKKEGCCAEKNHLLPSGGEGKG
jgi:(2Fe-2S) ferredoxin